MRSVEKTSRKRSRLHGSLTASVRQAVIEVDKVLEKCLSTFPSSENYSEIENDDDSIGSEIKRLSLFQRKIQEELAEAEGRWTGLEGLVVEDGYDGDISIWEISRSQQSDTVAVEGFRCDNIPTLSPADSFASSESSAHGELSSATNSVETLIMSTRDDYAKPRISLALASDMLASQISTTHSSMLPVWFKVRLRLNEENANSEPISQWRLGVPLIGSALGKEGTLWLMGSTLKSCPSDFQGLDELD